MSNNLNTTIVNVIRPKLPKLDQLKKVLVLYEKIYLPYMIHYGMKQSESMIFIKPAKNIQDLSLII